MTDIVVSVPQTYEGRGNFYNKVYDIGKAFWSMGKTPKKIAVHDWVWFVNEGKVHYGAEIKKIVRGPRPPLKNADGYNPAIPKGGCRLYFFGSESAHVWTDPDDTTHFPPIPSKGFQGFRYKWWDWPYEIEEKTSIDNQAKRS